MLEDLISKIKLLSNTYTKKEMQIASFVLSNPQDVLYMSINELADKCGVGDTSVFRFCKRLDKNGYMDFKMHLAQTLSTRDDIDKEEIKTDDSLETFSKEIIETSNEALNETLGMNDIAKIKKVADLMTNAGRVFFFGSGSSMATAYEAYIRFMRISPKFSFDFGSHIQSMSASLLKKGDVAVAISYSGSTKNVIDTAKTAKKAGAQVVAITHFSKSQLTDIANYSLLCGAHENPSKSGSFYSKVAQIFMIELLYHEFYMKNLDISKKNRVMTMSAISDKLI